jgi:hyperosmotically inducible periplasmic protein
MNGMVRLVCSLAVWLVSLPGIMPLEAQTPANTKPAGSDEKPALPREIHHQLELLPFYSVFDIIAFTTNGGEVTLTGQVLRPTLKHDAETTVKSLEGVTSVVNHIELLPISASDDELRRGIYRAIYESSSLARYAVQTVPAIHILVKGGDVVLEGWVGSLDDKNLAGTRASGVANVRSVKNNLVVQARENARQ